MFFIKISIIMINLYYFDYFNKINFELIISIFIKIDFLQLIHYFFFMIYYYLNFIIKNYLNFDFKSYLYLHLIF